MKDFKEELKELPERPGVYLMKKSDGEIIYVGKAINLKNRVRSYFQSSKGKDPRIVAMVSHIDHFDYMIVENEVEALVLESNFIKEHRPRYNILLRDDKQYPYIKITNEKFPRILKVRRVLDDKGTYFGPFPNALAVNDTIDLLQRIYKIRTCNLNFDKGQQLKRPCMNFFIDRCPAPCVGKASESEYMENIAKITKFLNGDSKELIAELQDRMHSYSKTMNFEAAASYRDYIKSVEYLNERQKITTASGKDIDMIAISMKDEIAAAQVFFMRDGKFVDQEYFILKNEFDDSKEEIMSSFLKQFYLDIIYVPQSLLLNVEPNELDSIQEFLTDKRKLKVTISIPQRGEKKAQINMVEANANEMLQKHLEKLNKRERNKNEGLEQLKAMTGIADLSRIECYDISNISGVSSVGSMVVFKNGKKESKEYRKFKIKTVEGPDDYSSHREMLTRRLNRAVQFKQEGKNTGFGELPNAILMDGGKGQVNVALDVLKEFNINIPVLGLVKDDKHKTRGIIYKNEEYNLKVSSPIYRFVYAIQEEVHRFAINYHRKLREKDMVSSQLDEIKGIGAVKRKSLLLHFKSVDAISKASVEELQEAEGISERNARAIKRYFEGEQNGN